MEIIQQESHQDVQGVRGHIGCMTTKERSIKSQPAFQK